MIAIIILNWNNAPDTLECLQSVFASDDPDYCVYVVDNGSKDDSASILKKAYPQICLIENGANLGFAEGNNRGILQAIDSSEYLFLLNNDAVIHPHTLSILRQAAHDHPNACALGPKIYFYDDPATIWYGGGGWNPQTASFYHRYRNVDDSPVLSQEIEKTGYVCGCALFLRVSFIRNVGLMDPRFFLIWEEIDWCYRMQKYGYDCLYVPQAMAWHKISNSFTDGKRGPTWYYFYSRNRLLWMERHLSLRERWKIMRKVLWPEWKDLVHQLKGPNRTIARASLIGVRDYLLRRFGSGEYKKLL